MTNDLVKTLIFEAARGGPATAHGGSTETNCRRQDRAALKGQRSRVCEGSVQSQNPEPRLDQAGSGVPRLERPGNTEGPDKRKNDADRWVSFAKVK